MNRLQFFFLKSTLCFVALLLLMPVVAFAQTEPPQFMTVDGRLYDSTTPEDPLLDTSVLMKIQILNPAKTCILYEEEQTVSTLSSNGYFNVRVGSPTVGAESLKRTTATIDVGNSMMEIFQNQNAAIAGKTSGGAGCGYTPVAGDTRYFRFVVTPSTTGVTSTLTPDMQIDSVPQSLVAETLQGMTPSNFVQTNTDVTQAKVNTLFGASYTTLSGLLAGSSSLYLQNTTNGTVIPNRATNPVAPTAGQIWYDSDDFVLRYYDGTSVLTLGTSGGDPTKLPLAGGIMAGAIDMGTNDITDVGHITQAAQRTFRFGVYTTIQQGTLIATPLVAGHEGTVWYNTTTNKLMFWDGTAEFAVSPVDSVFGRTGAVVAAASDYNAVQIDNTPAGAVSATEVQAAINELDSEKVAKAGDTMTGQLNMGPKGVAAGDGGAIAFTELAAAGTNTVTIRAPDALGANYVLTLPANDGDSGQYLQTDGNGLLTWVTPAGVGETNTASNQGVGGVGVYDAKSGVDLQFRNINAASNKVSVVLDAGSKEVDINVNEANFDPTAIPNTAAGTIAATNVQAAINELDSEKVASTRAVNTAAGSGLSGGGDLSVDRSLSVNINGTTAETAVAGTDEILIYDASATALRKMTRTNFVLSETEVDAMVSNNGYLSSEVDTLAIVTGRGASTATNITLNTQAQARFADSAGGEYAAIQAPATIGTNYVLTLPDTAGTNGQVLSTNGSGVLNWIAIPSAPVSSVFSRTGAVVAAASDYDANQIDNTPAGAISANDVQAAINELDSEKVAKAGDTMTGQLNMGPKGVAAGDGGAIAFTELAAGGTNTAIVRAPDALGANYVLTLPLDDGDSGQYLQTDGNGVLAWVTPAGVGETNTASNQGAGGVGVFKQKTTFDLEFRNINAASNKISVALDVGNNEIDINVAEANLDLASIPNTPAGTIAATNAQAAINELDSEKVASARAINTAAGSGLSGGGDLSADRSLSVNITGSTAETVAAANDEILIYDTSATALRKMTRSDFLTGYLTSEADTLATVTGRGASTTYNITMSTEAAVRFADTTGGEYAAVKAPANLTANYTLTLPPDDGLSGQYLQTDGAGVLSWITPAGVGETNTASNQGVGGVGLFDAKSTFDLQFRNLNAASNKVTVALDAGNKEVDLDVNEANFNTSAIPNTAAGSVAAANVQAAINELDSEKLAKAGDTMTGNLTLNAQNEVRYADSDSSSYVAVRSPTVVGANVTLTLPATAGSANQVLTTDGAGVLSWTTSAAAPVTSVFSRTGAVVAVAGDYTATQISSTAAGTLAATNVQTALNELDTEKVATTRAVNTAADSGIAGGGDLTADRSLSLNINGTTALGAAVDAADELLIYDVSGSVLRKATRSQFVLSETEVDAMVANNGYLSAEADTLSTVTGRGAATASNITLNAQAQIRLADSDSSNYISLASPATVAANVTLTLPATAGVSGQYLQTDGAGILNWVTPSGVGETNTASNQGVGGVGLFDAKSTFDLQFRNINAASNKVSVALDAANKEVDINVNEANFALGAIPNTAAGTIAATNAQAAINELDSEKVATTRAVNTFAGSGLTGGGDLSADRSLSVNITGTTAETSAAGTDEILIYDTSATALRKMTRSDFLTGYLTTEADTLSSVTGRGASTTNSITMSTEAAVRFADTTGGEYAAVKAPANLTANYTLTLPQDDGLNGQYLQTDGAGVLSWVTPSGVGETNTASNQGAGGVGVFKQKTTFDLEFRSINAASNKISVALDAGNNEIDIDVNESNFSTSALPNTPAGNIAATNVQAALNELDSEKVAKAGDTMTGNLTFNAQSASRYADSDSSNYVAIQSPAAVGTNYTLTLPTTAGSASQVLTTDGAGVLSWTTPSSGVTADSLNFTDFADAMTLDASTDIAASGTNVLSITNTGTGNSFVVNDVASDTSPFVVDQSGNVGIGTTIPSTILDIAGALTSRPTGTGTGQTGQVMLRELAASPGGTDTVTIRAPDSVTTSFNLTLPNTAGATGQVLQTDGSGILSWINAASSVADDSLNFDKLADALALDASTDIGLDGAEILSITNAGTANSFVVNDQAGDTSPFVIDTNGNVGIGTTAPVEELETYGVIQSSGSSGGVRIGFNCYNSSSSANASGCGMRFQAGSVPRANVHGIAGSASTGGHLAFETRQSGTLTETMRIDENGRVGIGTTNPTTSLDIVGDIEATLTATNTSSVRNMTSIQGTLSPGAASTADLRSVYSIAYSTSGNVNGATMRGVLGEAEYAGTANLGSATGFSAFARNSSTGSIGTARAGDFAVDNSGGGTITNGYGVYTGTIAATNKWSIYANDATAPSYFAGNVGIGTTIPGTRLDAVGAITSRPYGTATGETGQLIMRELVAGGTETVAIRAPDAITTSYSLTLPATAGSASQVLTTNGSGVLSWTTPTATVADDSLNFDKFSDTMTLDASTDIAASGTNVLSITNGGTGNSFVVNDVASDTTPFIIDASGSIGIGTTAVTAGYVLEADGIIRSTGTSGAQRVGYNCHNSSTSANAAGCAIRFDMGTVSRAEIKGIAGTSSTGGHLAFETRQSGTLTETMRIDENGRVGIGTSVPTYNMSLSGQTAQTIGMERHQTAATAGNNLTINAGGARSAGTNLTGGDLYLRAGTSTGNAGSNIFFQIAGRGYPSSGTADNTPVTALQISQSGEAQFTYTSQNSNSGGNGLAVLNTMGSPEGAVLSLEHTRGGTGLSNNDTAGQIDFMGMDAGNNRLRFGRVYTTVPTATAGSVASTMGFQTMVNSTLADRLTIQGGNVGIGTTQPAVSLDFNTKTDGVRLPAGTTAQRPTGATGIIRYNTDSGSLETYSNSNWSGITEVIATATGTSQNANIGATTLYTPSVDSYYRIDCVVVLTTVATTSSTLPTCTLSFTDSDADTFVSRNISNTNAANTLGYAAATLGNPFFYAKGGTAIQYSTTGYASSGATAMRYSIRIKLTRIP